MRGRHTRRQQVGLRAREEARARQHLWKRRGLGRFVRVGGVNTGPTHSRENMPQSSRKITKSHANSTLTYDRRVNRQQTGMEFRSHSEENTLTKQYDNTFSVWKQTLSAARWVRITAPWRTPPRSASCWRPRPRSKAARRGWRADAAMCRRREAAIRTRPARASAAGDVEQNRGTAWKNNQNSLS